jgi:hypothetical protein
MGDSELEHRLATLGDAMAQSRRAWRSLYGCFWQLRHENTIRRPSWRVEMETQAWKAMRAEVRRYGELRAQRRELARPAPSPAPPAKCLAAE